MIRSFKRALPAFATLRPARVFSPARSQGFHMDIYAASHHVLVAEKHDASPLQFVFQTAC